jgi:hypothetical protein
MVWKVIDVSEQLVDSSLQDRTLFYPDAESRKFI